MAQTAPVNEIAAPPGPDDVRAAARRLRGVARLTPLVPDPVLAARLARPVFIKAEGLQRTGSFKIRGAYNRLSALEPSQRRNGVVAFSSGNHAQGVAAAAQSLSMPALIVMPSDAPKTKVEGTRSYGAEIVFYDRATESREEISARLATERGAVLVPSFDDPFIIAGQGTLALEVLTALAAQGETLGAFITPVGGGGLASGIALALEGAGSGAALYGAEPAGFDDAARSLAYGRIEKNARNAGSLQDALLSPSLGALTFPILKRRMAASFTVTDADALAAMRHAALHLKLVAEPGGAAALAAVITGQVTAGEGALVVLLSGANADRETLASAMA